MERRCGAASRSARRRLGLSHIVVFCDRGGTNLRVRLVRVDVWTTLQPFVEWLGSSEFAQWLGQSTKPVAGLARDIAPWRMAGLILSLISGALIFTGGAVSYFEGPWFRWKMTLLIIALAVSYTHL